MRWAEVKLRHPLPRWKTTPLVSFRRPCFCYTKSSNKQSGPKPSRLWVSKSFNVQEIMGSVPLQDSRRLQVAYRLEARGCASPMAASADHLAIWVPTRTLICLEWEAVKVLGGSHRVRLGWPTALLSYCCHLLHARHGPKPLSMLAPCCKRHC